MKTAISGTGGVKGVSHRQDDINIVVLALQTLRVFEAKALPPKFEPRPQCLEVKMRGATKADLKLVLKSGL